MVDPRNDVDFEGIDDVSVPLKYDGSIVYDATKPGGSVSVGLAVKTTGHRTVGLTTDGSEVTGKLVLVEDDGFCTVQVEGGTNLPGGTAATLTPGSRIVGAALGGAPGYIRSVAAATLAEVAVARHRIMESATTTAVKVMLGDG
jgi:hypothetical protein